MGCRPGLDPRPSVCNASARRARTREGSSVLQAKLIDSSTRALLVLTLWRLSRSISEDPATPASCECRQWFEGTSSLSKSRLYVLPARDIVDLDTEGRRLSRIASTRYIVSFSGRNGKTVNKRCHRLPQMCVQCSHIRYIDISFN